MQTPSQLVLRSFLKETPILICVLMPLSVYSELVPASFDFGTDAGKVTIASSGFSFHQEPGTDVIVTDQADAVRFDNPTTINGSIDLGVLYKSFSGLGPGESNDFTITSEFSTVVNGNFTRRLGMQLFFDPASSRPDRSGFAALIQNGTTLTLTNRGMDPGAVTTQTFATNFFDTSLNPTVMTLDGVFGTYAGGNNLRLTFTVANGGNSESITADVNTTGVGVSQTGFGLAYNGDDGTTFDFDNFAVIPEPSTMMIGLFGAIGLYVFRRKAC